MKFNLEKLKSIVPVELYEYFLSQQMLIHSNKDIDFSHLVSFSVVDLTTSISIFARTKSDFLYIWEYVPSLYLDLENYYNFNVYNPKDVKAIIDLY